MTAYWMPESYSPMAPTPADLANAISQPEYTLGFDPAERTERTYAAPLHFFNQIKEQNNMVSMEQHEKMLKDGLLFNISKLVSQHYPMPEAVTGNLYNQYPGTNSGDPWKAHVGGLNISHKSDANRHIELALEHLVAAQTIPTLVKAWEREAELTEKRVADEFTRLLNTPDYLAVLKWNNASRPKGVQYASWREAQVSWACSDEGLLGFIEQDKSMKQEADELDAFLCSDEAVAALDWTLARSSSYSDCPHATWADFFSKHLAGNKRDYVGWAMGLRGKAQAERDDREADYRAKRREELAQNFSVGVYSYENISSSTQPAIDRIITMEINDGALA